MQNINVDETKIEAELSLTPAEKYNVNIAVKLFITITDKLDYRLETTNLGDKEFIFSEALHAYFNISAIDDIKIEGLKGHRYKNSLDGNLYTLGNDLQINGEFDSIFLEQTSPIKIIDKGFSRTIILEKQNSKTTVVWNPAKDLAEMSPAQYKTFVCVEPSNVGEYCVKLAPHTTHAITTRIYIEK